jgi:hypothetical protein
MSSADDHERRPVFGTGAATYPLAPPFPSGRHRGAGAVRYDLA